MTETVLVIGGTGQLGAPVARQLRRDGYRSGCSRERCQQLLTATPIWSTSRATWTTPSHYAAPWLAVPQST